MPMNQLQKLEFIENNLLKIKEIISPEDAYLVCDEIVTSIDDELLADHIHDMLKAMGYSAERIGKISTIIKQIQK